jgi:ATP-binding cassette subfamily C (CFTR/MRP) protein 1
MMLYQIMIVIAPISAIRIHQVLVDTTFRAPMSFFESTDSSVLLNRFSQDMSMSLLPMLLTWQILLTFFFFAQV